MTLNVFQILIFNHNVRWVLFFFPLTLAPVAKYLISTLDVMSGTTQSFNTIDNGSVFPPYLIQGPPEDLDSWVHGMMSSPAREACLILNLAKFPWFFE